MSWLKTSTIDTNPLISLSLFPYSFKSSINRRQLVFSPPPPKMYLVLALRSKWVSGIMHFTNNTGDKLSPWKIPLLKLNFTKLSPHEVNSVCQLVIDLFTNSRIMSDSCTSSRLSIIPKLLINNPCYSQIYMPLPRVTSSQSIINLWSLYFFSYNLFARLVLYSNQQNCKYF